MQSSFTDFDFKIKIINYVVVYMFLICKRLEDKTKKSYQWNETMKTFTYNTFYYKSLEVTLISWQNTRKPVSTNYKIPI